jgi:branched-subunit amino acid transport protein AzlD
VLLHASWVAGATLGGLLGTVLPLNSLRGLDFALSAPLIVMVVLAVHPLRDVPADSAPAALPFAVAVLVTVGLHLWRHNALISILAGTTVHVAPATVLARG